MGESPPPLTPSVSLGSDNTVADPPRATKDTRGVRRKLLTVGIRGTIGPRLKGLRRPGAVRIFGGATHLGSPRALCQWPFRLGRRGVLAGALIMTVLALVVSPPILNVASGVTYQRHGAHHQRRAATTTTATSPAISRLNMTMTATPLAATTPPRVTTTTLPRVTTTTLPRVTTTTLPRVTTTTPPRVTTTADPFWMMAASSAQNLAASPAYQLGLDQPSVSLQGSAPLSNSPVPSGWISIPEERWTSEAQFAADVAAGAIPSVVRLVHYDDENWAQTPLNEQQQPGLYMRLFCQLAHQHGWLCATGPARDLCPLAYPSFQGTNSACYLANNLAGQAAAYADFTDIQGQGVELDGTTAYAQFIGAAADQAHVANSAVITLGNLSPTPNGSPVTADMLNADARAVYPSSVAGFYMTITSADAATAAQFFALFEPAGPASAPH